MITGTDLYHVLTALVPLYVAMILAYGSVKWWKIFTPDQCSGINRFVALFAVPLLSFHFISTNNPYAMNYKFIAADTLQKIVILFGLALWSRFSSRGSIEWSITFFSLSTLPNTLVMGIPMLQAMYGEFSGSLMVQIVVLQCIIWYTLVLFLFEYKGAQMLIKEQFPDTARSIVSIRVDSDVMSLDGREPLETKTEVSDDGKLHVTLRKSTSSRSDQMFSMRSHVGVSLAPTPSSLTNVEIYSLQSSRGSSFNSRRFGNLGFGEVENGLGAERKAKDLHMFVWGSSASSRVSDYDDYGGGDELGLGRSPKGSDRGEAALSKQASMAADEETKPTALPPATVMTRLTLIMVWRKIVINPNTYSSLIGLAWSLISFRWNVKMPAIVAQSIAILSDAGLGMAMFSLGLFMALQPKMIACGTTVAAFSMSIRFIVGPAVMAAASIAIGLRGVLLRVAIVQAALPQGIVPFVFSKEYDVHPDILSTAVIFGMLLALPITLLYYIFLGL